jgi:VanZ family protein
MLLWLRLIFFALVVGVLYFALTPGPLGAIIEMDEHRHIIAFSVLPLASSIAWPRLSLKLQYAGSLVFGAGIEVVQEVMGMGRAGELHDWIVDAIASAIALSIVWAVRKVEPDATEALN